MTNESRFVLSGYVCLADHGFALPCYRREEGGNAWHVAVAEIAGDKASAIARFENLDCPGITMLEEPLRRSVAVRDIWQDVFLWGTKISVGGRHEILADIDDLMPEVSALAPLTAFDAAFDMGSDDGALVAQAASWLQARCGKDVAEQTLCETIFSHVAGLRTRRWAMLGSWDFSPTRRDVSVVATGQSSFALMLSVRARQRLQASGMIFDLVAELRQLVGAADLTFMDGPQHLLTRDETPTPTHDHRLHRRFADFETLPEALDYAARGVRGLNFHDARGNLSEPYPFSQLREDAQRQAHRLIAAGVKSGDRVALIAETCPDFASLFFGTILAGAWPVPLPLPTSFGGAQSYIDQLKVQLVSCDARLLMFPPEIEAMCGEAARLADVNGMNWAEFALREADVGKLPKVKGEDIAYLQYSSGATRFPHGIALSHRAVLSNLAAHSHGIALSDTDRYVSWLPWYHDLGLVTCFLSAVANQVSADLLLTENFARRPLAWLDVITRNRGTSVSFSPSYGYDICARRISSQSQASDRFDLSRWRIAGNGGDTIRADVMQSFVDAFEDVGFKASAFLPIYGLAEVTQMVSIMPPGEGIVVELIEEVLFTGYRGESADKPRMRAVVNCGRPARDMQVEIRSDTGKSIPDGDIGEIWCTGTSLMAGYFRDQESTEECIKDGWLDTGDMGYVSNGYVFVIGRARDLIYIDGKNHWPEDIEREVEQLAGFKQGDIVAFSTTSPVGKAIPTILAQCRTSDEAERARLRTEIANRVHHVIGVESIVELVPPRTLPRTSSGKLSRARARNLYLSGEIKPYRSEAEEAT